MSTVGKRLLPLTGKTLTLFLYARQGGAAVNGSGDVGSEGTDAFFTFTVSEELSRIHFAVVKNGTVPVYEGHVNMDFSPAYIGDPQQLSAGATSGPGSIQHTDTINMPDGVTPVVGAEVWISTDEDGETVVGGTKVTNDFGQVTFLLDTGTYYRWVDHPEFQFDNPQQFEVA